MDEYTWHNVRLTDDDEVFRAHAERHKAHLLDTIPRIRGQIIRVRFRSKSDDHTYWDVHPDDVKRLTPEWSSAIVCSCIVEAD